MVLVLLFAAEVWGIVEVERLVIEHGSHKDLDFWIIVAMIVVGVAAMLAVSVAVALRLLQDR